MDLEHNNILNLLMPDDGMPKEKHPGANLRLDAVINYLKSWINAIESRRAYLVPPEKWTIKKISKPRDTRVGGRIIISKDYYATMAPAKTEVMDHDDGFKSLARPLINSEFVYIYNPKLTDIDIRSTVSNGANDITEKQMVILSRKYKNEFIKIKLSSFKTGKDEQFFVSEPVAASLEKYSDCAIWFPQSTDVIKRRREYAEMLRNSPGRQHMPLKKILEKDYIWPESKKAEIAEHSWIDLTKPELAGTEEQRDFVRKALGTDDFALVWGPAGSGKTTAICEFIKQVVSLGKKVIMVGSTHVSVDNVLEKFTTHEGSKVSKNGDQVIAVRVGNADKVSKSVESLLMSNFVSNEAKRISNHLRRVAGSNIVSSEAATMMLAALEEDLGSDFMKSLDDHFSDEVSVSLHPDKGALLRLIMDSANLVGGTPIGILRHPAIQTAKDSRSYPEFDYLIVDEASKMTFDEFLVPAMCAKRWIIVGDPFQLAPFCEEAELGSALLASMDTKYFKEGVSLGLNDSIQIRRKIKNAVEFALKERAVRFKGGDYQKDMDMKRSQALEALAEYDADISTSEYKRINLRDFCEQTLAIALPSILEALIGERTGMLPSPRSIIRPFAGGLDSRLVELKYQFRMDPHIANFCMRNVYSGKLLLSHESLPPKSRLHSESSGNNGRFVVLSSPSESFSGIKDTDRLRESRAQLVLGVWEILKFADWAKKNPREKEIWKAYFISTYKNQNGLASIVVRYLKDNYTERLSAINLEANTVDSCQGHEADLVVLSLVKENQTPFMRSLNRMNVAFTRARSRLVILGDLPQKTHEAQISGNNQTLIDELNDYDLSSEAAKGLDEAIEIINQALT